jgi:hypothetical protein
MILVSLFVRGRIDDKGGGSSTSSGNGSALAIACIPELSSECNAIASDKVKVTVEDPTTTLTKLDQYDGWLTVDPWPAIAAAQQQGGAPVEVKLASSALQIAVVQDRAAALTTACGGTIAWKCLGEKRGQQWSDLGGDPGWGQLKVGLPPRKSAIGLLLYADAVASYFGRTDYGTNDFDAEFGAWQANLNGAFTEESPLQTFVNLLPAAYTAVGTTGAATRIGLGAKADRIALVDNQARAVVVLSQTSKRDVRGLASNNGLKAALNEGGWTDDPNIATGLPAPGVLLALLSL